MFLSSAAMPWIFIFRTATTPESTASNISEDYPTKARSEAIDHHAADPLSFGSRNLINNPDWQNLPGLVYNGQRWKSPFTKGAKICTKKTFLMKDRRQKPQAFHVLFAANATITMFAGLKERRRNILPEAWMKTIGQGLPNQRITWSASTTC